ncbi:MAG: hypothetical protein A2017_00995 [Lentisphaerae bacterium GWF2_44_16]|nr:MAG: hypothetical protein A2017_00995 [Lentisphaerae bacterium GWF2_44_16]
MKNISFTFSNIKVDFEPVKNLYSLSFPGFTLKNCFVSASFDGNEVSDFKWTLKKSSKTQTVFSSKNEMGIFSLTLSGGKNAGGVEGVCIELSGNLNKKHEKVSLMALCVSTLKVEHLLSHGRKMGGCRLVKFPVADEKSFSSHFQCLLSSKGVSMQFSHPLIQKNVSTVSGIAKGANIKDLKVSTLFDPCCGKSIKSEPLWIYVSKDGHQLMRDWAEDNKEEESKKICDCPAGWNSWDYYRWTITEDEVLKNAEFIASDPVLSKHIKRIIVDDGWQYCYGEWEANSLFPSGMEKLARNLKKMGFAPGLWFAPTIMEPHARISQNETDMLAKGRSGLPCLAFTCMKRYGFVLDPTQEKVKKWIYELFKRYVGMGYEYFKLDFLASTLFAPCFADPSVPKGQIIRNVVEATRKATEGKARILGCNYPFDAGTKYVDYVRTSADIHSSWHAVTENVFSIAARFWSHNKFWVNDPDFTLVRNNETANDPKLHSLKACLVYVEPEGKNYPPLFSSSLVDTTIDETIVLLSLVLISGGAINLSDNLPKLNKKGLELLRKTVSAPKGDGGIALDLFKSEFPAYWIQKTENGYRAMIINWTDKKAEFSLNLSEQNIHPSSAVNFWTGESVKLKANTVNTVLKAHSCLMLTLK